MLACVAPVAAAGAPTSRRTLAVSAALALLASASITEALIARSNDLNAPALASVKRLAAYPGVPAEAWILGRRGGGLPPPRPRKEHCGAISGGRNRSSAGLGLARLGGRLQPDASTALGWVDSATARKSATLLHVDFPVDRRAACGEAAEYEQQDSSCGPEVFNNRIDQVVHFGGPIGRDAPRRRSCIWQAAEDSSSTLTAAGRTGVRRHRLARDDRRRETPPVRADAVGLPFGSQGSSLTLWRAEKPLRVGPRHAQVPPRADGRPC